MDELDLFRNFRRGVAAPSPDAQRRASARLTSAFNEVVGRETAARVRHGRRRWPLAAIAASILVGGLLVAPAFGISDRLLDLVQGAPARPEVRSPVWSPDGRRIAVVSRRDGKALYVMNADGSGLRIVARGAWFATPAWSPDGRRIAFQGQSGALYVVNADGSGQRALARWGNAPAWSPDGRRIAFVITTRLYVANADGSGRRTLARVEGSGDNNSLAWSPDGQKLLFVKGFGAAPLCATCSRLYVLNADGSGLRDLTRNLGGSVPGAGPPSPANQRGPASDPVWSPDGRKIAFVRLNTRHGVYVINADGSAVRNLTPRPRGAAYAAPAWSPDGRKITFTSERDGNSEIYLMNADGSGQRNLTLNLAYDGDPDWSPDGRKITFVSNRDGRHAVYVMNADGSGQRSLEVNANG
jgi:Tol biopolymer transport system component